jgi:hypothetical protein
MERKGPSLLNSIQANVLHSMDSPITFEAYYPWSHTQLQRAKVAGESYNGQEAQMVHTTLEDMGVPTTHYLLK